MTEERTRTVTTVTPEVIEEKILLIRGQRVMLDVDLADLYGVATGALTRQVRRNLDRFPSDFCFQLTKQEFTNLKCQNGIANWGGRRTVPYAFTEQGVAMLSSVLKSKRAASVNVQIMRTFVQLRHLLSTNKELSHKLDQLEAKYDDHFAIVFEAIRELMEPPPIPPKRRIGFNLGSDDDE